MQLAGWPGSRASSLENLQISRPTPSSTDLSFQSDTGIKGGHVLPVLGSLPRELVIGFDSMMFVVRVV